ncbi:hypothetical protein EGJ52_23080 [Pseudomonas luteola]|uniref:hypothetical protein n=1 Tax=Pseudomonas luteola TaxID=47886 RepID=UPI000F7B91E7|nr:hypothetical protein [Pseudomonas luteola]RRW39938.1 hypothetical protein EGJ52_23080 [Pseudomonas luteola]
MIAKETVNKIWSNIQILNGLTTPDKHRPFSIVLVKDDRVKILTGKKSSITLWRSAFESTIKYLHENGVHGEKNRIEIRSNNDIKKAGPLCLAAREQRKTRVINYILPILSQLEIAKTKEGDGKENSTTWLVE